MLRPRFCRKFMTNSQLSTLQRLLQTQCSIEAATALLRTVQVAPSLLAQSGDEVSRAVLAKALNLLLFRDLLDRVPAGRRYVEECVAQGGQVVFDHGALRTVALAGM